VREPPYRVEVKPYGRALVEAARHRPEILCLSGDLTKQTEVDLFQAEFPDRFIHGGMAEANMMGMAGALARCGYQPFVHTFGVFATRRPYDQIANAIAYPNLPVRIIGFMPGVSTPGGPSHQATDDVALMRALPNMTVVDVADAMNAALALAAGGEADRARLGIRGGSAGGWTALAAVTSGIAVADGRSRGGVFAAVASYFGVSDLRGFAAQTHDFESRYLDGLIGPLPECDALYTERAPVGHVNDATCPVLLLQGLDDPVVPPAQAESIAADLAAHGIPYAYITFEGESHGFRKAENIVASLEAELSFYGQIMGFTPPGVPPVPLC